MSKLRDLGWRLQAAPMWMLLQLARVLPMRPTVEASAALFALVGPRLRQQRRALENLAIAFPAKSEAERKAIARAMWANMGRVAAEILFVERILADRSRFEIPLAEHWRERMSTPGPSIGVTAHLGNWEFAIWPMTLFGRAPAGVYKPIPNPYVDRVLRRRRELLFPSGLFGKGPDGESGGGHRTARLLVDHVRRNGCMGFVCDHFDKRGIVVPFMGRQTRMTPVPAMIARHVDARVWIGRCLRIGTDSRFRLDIVELELPITKDRTAGTLATTTAIFAQFEAWIRETPEQWMWWNTRWVTPEAAAQQTADEDDGTAA